MVARRLLYYKPEVNNMESLRLGVSKVVMMSTDLMNLYEVRGRIKGQEFMPITFYNAQECLDMLMDIAAIDADQKPVLPANKAERVERQWGELELRLSFFTEAYKWQ